MACDARILSSVTMNRPGAKDGAAGCGLWEQAAGTTGDQVRLIDAALAASPGGRRDWGICTECGMGRVNADEIPALLDLHRQIIAAR